MPQMYDRQPHFVVSLLPIVVAVAVLGLSWYFGALIHQ